MCSFNKYAIMPESCALILEHMDIVPWDSEAFCAIPEASIKVSIIFIFFFVGELGEVR